MSATMILPSRSQVARAEIGSKLCIADRLAEVLDPKPHRAILRMLAAFIFTLTKCCLAAGIALALCVAIVASVQSAGPVVMDSLVLVGRRLNSAMQVAEAILRIL